MAKYSVPGIYIKEVDNTLQSNSQASLGVGAIVFKANKGPVNQRVLMSNYSQFKKTFGEPESDTDFGHFAAQNFLSNSTELLCVRATMGDEEYAQIQYPYTDSKDNNNNTDVAEFRYVDNDDGNNLKLISNLEADLTITAYTSGDRWQRGIEDGQDTGAGSWVLSQCGQVGTIYDLTVDNGVSANAVFKAIGANGDYDVSNLYEEANGKCFEYASQKAFFTSAGLEATPAEGSFTATLNADNNYVVKYYIPADVTLNGSNTTFTAVYDSNTWTSVSAKSYGESLPSASGVSGIDAAKVKFIDWDDCIEKSYIVDKDEFEKTTSQVVGITYRKFNEGLYTNDLAIKPASDDVFDITIKEMDDLTPDELDSIAAELGVDTSEICNKTYRYLEYCRAVNGYATSENGSLRANILNERMHEVVYADELMMKTGNTKFNERLFYIFKEYEADKPTTVSVRTAEKINAVVSPWQTDTNKIVAIKTSEALKDDKYQDGYTLIMDTDDEPGNGDIEEYVSNKTDQLIIAASNPGEHGNTIGVSIITPECADVKALNHPNAFNWKYRYDDEDQVDKDVDDLTWKKIYRINVYTKTKTETVKGAWGFGMDSLLKDPVETWYVSNDPTVKDNEGNSLFAPTVINGHSEYIYVSRNSVLEARTSNGKYAMPKQTYSVYQLTGGKNSEKNEMVEKTAALKLYEDTQKANFDILFNVDAVETFNGRQRFAAHQRRIAEIASNRTMDIGVVQVTSKEDKTAKRMLSDGKAFTFNNGTYVACYAGYDKYYNDTLAQWIYLPKSVAAACAMAYCDNYAYPWMAPAGVSRGGVSYSSRSLTRLTDDEIGQLYDSNINTSRQCSGYGEVLWGQKTALKKESALNRINVRRCLNFIEKRLKQIMTPYLFQQNTANTRASAKNAINSLLSQIKIYEGIEYYSIQVTQGDDPHVMEVNLKIIPTECIEFISITVNVDRNSGVSVSES